MPLDEQEVKQLEEKFELLENKLRTTFLEVEKRFAEVKAQPLDIEDRIQELEDLILLMQLEMTKIKERTSVTTEFITPQAPNLAERLNRLEESLALKAAEEPKEEGEEKLFEEVETEAPARRAGPVVKEEVAEQKEEKPTKSLLEEVRQILSS